MKSDGLGSIAAAKDTRTRGRRHGLRPVRVHDTDGRLTPEFLASVNLRLGEDRGRPARRRGAVLVNLAAGLLFVLAAGLYAVSLRAQFGYVMTVKHEPLVSWIEAVALDAGMVIFTLLALGLARAGLPARIERLAIVACALGSAAMNLAAADSASIRSVLAYVMPPVFLALVVDRTVAVVRRHYLGEPDASAWSQLGRAALYGLRFTLAPLSTAKGIRRAVLTAAPVPVSRRDTAPADPSVVQAAAALDAADSPKAIPATAADAARQSRRSAAVVGTRLRALPAPHRDGTKTARFLDLVTERHGPLAAFPVGQVSRVCTELAPVVGLDPGAARKALRRQVLAARNGSQSSGEPAGSGSGDGSTR